MDNRQATYKINMWWLAVELDRALRIFETSTADSHLIDPCL